MEFSRALRLSMNISSNYCVKSLTLLVNISDEQRVMPIYSENANIISLHHRLF